MGDPRLPREAPVPPAPGELAEEARLGGSELGRAINAALLALSRTARSFTLYDARNQAVREFLGDLREKLLKALAAVGAPLELEVRAYELAFRGEVVYLERERERSLAFRLFRDGVRKLVLKPGLEWEELLGLVEILSVRYTGVRQQEDDIVTLLSKAAFPHIGFVAIEGFLPEEELQEGGSPVVVTHLEPPPDWDLPAPAAGAPAALLWRELPEAALQALRAEHDDEAPVRECLEAALELLERVADERQPLEEEHVEPLIFELRDFLLGEGAFEELIQIVVALERSAAADMRPRPSILARLGGKPQLQVLARWLRRQAGEPPAEVFRYLGCVPGEHLGDTIDLLEAEADDETRAALRGLLAGLAAERPRLLLERAERADARTAGDLLEALGRVAPELAAEAALQLKDRGDPRLQVAALRALGHSAYTPALGRAAVSLLRSPDAEVRVAAVEFLAGCGDSRVAEPLSRHLQERAGHGLSIEEAERLGEALARLDPAGSMEAFGQWLHPRSLLQRVVESPAQRVLHHAAVAGLGRLPGEPAEKLLRWFLGKSSGDLHRSCLAALVQRRREQRTRGGEGGHAG